MTKVLNIVTGKGRDITAALEVVDAMRQAIVDGEIVAFVAAGITAGDIALGYSGAVEGVSRLRMMGAIANLAHCYHSGALDGDN